MILDSLLKLRAMAGETSTLRDPAGWMFDMFGASPTDAGVPISERSAVGLSAVWTCVNVRAGLMASMPLNLYAPTNNGLGRKLARNRKEFGILHDRPSPEDSSYNWRHKMCVNRLLWGNSYSQIEDDGRGQLKYLWPYHPSHVRVEYGPTRGEYWYIVSGMGKDGGYVEQKVMPDYMIHLRGFTFEGVQGISVIQNHKRMLGLAVATEVFGSKFYANGAKASGMLMIPGRLKPDSAQTLKNSFEQQYAGVQNSGKTIVLEEGAKYEQLSIPQNDAQFIETRRMSRAEIAGMYGVPTILLPGSDDKASTYASSEVLNRLLIDYTLRDDCSLWEHELNTKLFPKGDHFCQFDIRDLQRGDTAARADYWQKRWQVGSISPNEIREDEGENPIPDGDKFYVPVNYVDASKPMPSQIEPSKPGSEPTPAQPAANPKPKPAKSAGFQILFSNLVGEIQKWENFSPKRASEKFLNMLVHPLAVELMQEEGRTDGFDANLLRDCAELLAMHVRELKPDDLVPEYDRLIYLLQKKEAEETV